jgi:hypothetical protein
VRSLTRLLTFPSAVAGSAYRFSSYDERCIGGLLIQEKGPDCPSGESNIWLDLSVFAGITQTYFERFQPIFSSQQTTGIALCSDIGPSAFIENLGLLRDTEGQGETPGCGQIAVKTWDSVVGIRAGSRQVYENR